MNTLQKDSNVIIVYRDQIINPLIPQCLGLFPHWIRIFFFFFFILNFFIRYFLYLHFKCYPLSWFPLPLLTNLPTPASWSWHSPTLGHGAFTGPRSSPPIDVQQGHPLLHIQMEQWVPPCVYSLVVGLEPLGALGVLVVSYCCPFYGAANPFSSTGPFSSSSIQHFFIWYRVWDQGMT